jgi:WD40 domain-containing protein
LQRAQVALRNTVAHPSSYYLGTPCDAALVIRDVAEIINCLWGTRTPGGRLHPAPVRRSVLLIAWDSTIRLEIGDVGSVPTMHMAADPTCVLVRASPDNLEDLTGFDARFETTRYPVEMLWGPGTTDQARAWLETHHPDGDEVDHLDRHFVIRHYDNRAVVGGPDLVPCRHAPVPAPQRVPQRDRDDCRPLHGRSKRALDNKDVEAHRHFMIAVAATTAFVFALMAGLGIEYVVAAAQKVRALENARNAVAMRAITQAQAQLADPAAGDDVRAYHWLMAAQSLATNEAKGSAYNAALGGVYSRPNLLNVAVPAPNVAAKATAITSDGRLAASGDKGPPQLWDPMTGKPTGPALERGTASDSPILAVAFTPDSRRVAAAYDTSIAVWNTASGAKIGEFPKDGYTTVSMALSPDGRTVALAGSGVRLWDVRTGKPLACGLTLGVCFCGFAGVVLWGSVGVS